jgi:hypothetical protein
MRKYDHQIAEAFKYGEWCISDKKHTKNEREANQIRRKKKGCEVKTQRVLEIAAPFTVVETDKVLMQECKAAQEEGFEILDEILSVLTGENTLTRRAIAEALDIGRTKNKNAELEPYVKFPDHIYKTPRAYRRKIGYVAKYGGEKILVGNIFKIPI